MNSARSFLREDRGAVTAEFTVLVPFFIFLLVLIADAATIYLTHTEMYNGAREISRRMATGELKNEDDVKTYAATKLFLGHRTYFVDADFASDRKVIIAVHLYEAAIFGYFFKPILGEELVAIAATGEEPKLE